MAAKPRVSIGLPVYNGEEFLQEALDSIMAQTYTDFELVIADNASTDGTEEMCRALAAKDPRVKYYRNDVNRGAAWNSNYVIELSSGEYFRWATHDDALAPECVQRCVDILDAYPRVVLCYSKTMLIDQNSNEIGIYEDNMHLDMRQPHQRLRHLLKHLDLCNAVFGMIRASALQYSRLMGNYSAADMVMLAELSLLGEFREIPEPLFYRRLHPGNSCVAHHSFDKRAVWFDPANKGKYRNAFFMLRLAVEQLRSIHVSPLSLADRLRCYSMVFEHWAARPRAIGGDFRRAWHVLRSRAAVH